MFFFSSLTGDTESELVRHFLIEPTSNGVKLKGCSNEPVFGRSGCVCRKIMSLKIDNETLVFTLGSSEISSNQKHISIIENGYVTRAISIVLSNVHSFSIVQYFKMRDLRPIEETVQSHQAIKIARFM